MCPSTLFPSRCFLEAIVRTLMPVSFSKGEKIHSVHLYLLSPSFSTIKVTRGPNFPGPLIALLSTAVASMYRPPVTRLQILALRF